MSVRYYLLIVLIQAVLKLFGFPKVYRVIRKMGIKEQKRGNEEAKEIIHRVTAQIFTACDRQLFEADCRHRSLALLFLLNRGGVDVELSIGVWKHPFGAHVWLTHDGEPISDPAKKAPKRETQVILSASRVERSSRE